MKQYQPTTPSRRQMTTVDYSMLTAREPYKPLTIKLKTRSGRNNRGVITVRHQEGGNKKLYRVVDFKQDKFNVPGKIETIEYDPYRNAFIALVLYKDGERRYILAAKDSRVGDEIITASQAPMRAGNRLQLKNTPVGYLIHNVEVRPGGGGKLARSAGSYAEILAHADGYTDLRLASKAIRKVPSDCYASLGQLSNPDHKLINIGKAGRSRWLGVRPTVRGTAMNPFDNPNGGGKGRQPRGTKKPKTRWGKVTGGHKTRNKKKWSNHLIVQRRK